jgi:hypothetical protein
LALLSFINDLTTQRIGSILEISDLMTTRKGASRMIEWFVVTPADGKCLRGTKRLRHILFGLSHMNLRISHHKCAILIKRETDSCHNNTSSEKAER